MAKQPCIEDGCERKKYGTHHRCSFHWLLTQPIEIGVQWAERRLKQSRHKEMFGTRIRVPQSEWPEGERWCSGCQSYVPLFYVSGSMCKACSSRKKHESHIQATYNLDPEEYRRLGEWQCWRCFICGRRALSRRLAVDHDHETGAVRGLLCSDNERGCNHVVIGALEGRSRDLLELARNIVAYFETYPIERMRAGEESPSVRERPDRRLFRPEQIDPTDIPPWETQPTPAPREEKLGSEVSPGWDQF